MSIRGKEVRPLINQDMHERLAIMAGHQDKQINELAGLLLEKAIAGEWHQVRLLIRRSERLGKRWKAVESHGGGDG